MDRYNAVIRIGGTINRTTVSKSDPDESVLDVMIGMINGADVSHEWGDVIAEIPVNAEDENDSQLLQYMNDDGLLEFKGESVPDGEFDELEAFLREEGIPYRRTCCAYGGFMGEDVYWVSGMVEPVIVLADDHGTDYVEREQVEKALRILNECRELIPHAMKYAMKSAKFDEAVNLLKEVCPERPNIPEFQIAS